MLAGELDSLDLAVYMAVAATTTPTLDHVFAGSPAPPTTQGDGSPVPQSWGPSAEHAAAAPQSTAWPPIAVTSPVVNLLLTPLGRRDRPHRAAHHVPITRHVTMPRTASFPAGHAAFASAFATGVARDSGVHTGVRYPVDVIAGSLTGTTLAAHRSRARVPPRPTGQRFERHLL
jgi:hypothetical protein